MPVNSALLLLLSEEAQTTTATSRRRRGASAARDDAALAAIGEAVLRTREFIVAEAAEREEGDIAKRERGRERKVNWRDRERY